MSALQKKIQLSRLPPIGIRGIGRGRRGDGGKRGMGIGRRDYSPVPWDMYFQVSKDLVVSPGNSFHVYMSGFQGPVCLFLHGGGFSALSWACLVKLLTEQIKCRCVAVDLRGHGDTVTEDESDLSAETQANDIRDVVKALYKDDPPPIILVGHSMGGALGVHVAYRDLLPSLIGLVVIDVVEGTAMDALTSMHSFLRSRPTSFKSLEHAIEWCVRSGHVRNIDSAKVSMIGQLKRLHSNLTATSEVSSTLVEQTSSTDTIQEEEDGETSQNDSKKIKTDNEQADPDFKSPDAPTTAPDQYTWRINLEGTAKHWNGWFEGLSSMFLSSNIPKMLLLAGVDRLDKELTIGQMQGKFQMQVLPQCGHAVHEDSPENVADVIATFLVRYKVAEPAADFNRTFPAC